MVHTRSASAAIPVNSIESAVSADVANIRHNMSLAPRSSTASRREKVRTLLAASSAAKRDKWVRMLREHCVLRDDSDVARA